MLWVSLHTGDRSPPFVLKLQNVDVDVTSYCGVDRWGNYNASTLRCDGRLGIVGWSLLTGHFSTDETAVLCYPPFSVPLFSSPRQTTIFGESGCVPIFSPPIEANAPHFFLSISIYGT